MTAPVLILVESQLAENIGSAARAMANCGLTELRLVRPDVEWPSERAAAVSSGALPLIDVRIFDTTAAALADLNYVLATTARARDMVKPVLTPRAGATEIRRRDALGQKCGLLFGPERTGLFNEDLTLADALLTVPLNPAFTSLNLAQAVLLIGYEWWTQGLDTPPVQARYGDSQPATKAELINLFEQMEKKLDSAGFFAASHMRPTMVQNIRNTLQRAEMTEQEVRTFHGIVTALVKE
jgi:tRNA/rRNA methyltransferase